MPGVPNRVTKAQQHKAKEQKLYSAATKAPKDAEEVVSSPAPQPIRRPVDRAPLASPTISKNQQHDEDEVLPTQVRKLRSAAQATVGVVKMAGRNGGSNVSEAEDMSYKENNGSGSSPGGGAGRLGASSPVAPPAASAIKRVSIVQGLGPLIGRRATLDSSAPVTNSSSPSSNAATARLLKFGFSVKAREYLSAGFLDEAIHIAQKEHDIIGWSVALTLAGDAPKAVDIIEAVVISSCLVVYQKRCRGGTNFSKASNLNYGEVLEFILKGGDAGQGQQQQQSPGASQDDRGSPVLNPTAAMIKSLPPPKEHDYRETILEVCSVVPYEELHQWYLTATLLHTSYAPPTNAWLRHFFSLFLATNNPPPSTNHHHHHHGHQQNNPKKAVTKTTTPSTTTATTKTMIPQTRQLTTPDVEELLIAQCSEYTVFAVNTYVSFLLGRYRSAIFSATEVLKKHGDDVCMRFVRCICALKVCDRKTAAEDCTHLMHSESLIISTTGCALAAFAVPLKSAHEAVVGFRSQIYKEELFVHSLMEWAHALTLLQLGEFKAARLVAEEARRYSPPKSIREWMDDVLVVCYIALRDQEALLHLHLTPARQLHAGMVPAFGGGYDNGSINTIPIDSDLADFINPMRVSTYADVRKMIAIHTTRARSLFSFGNLKEAWDEINNAVGCSEEIIGSTDFSFSDLAPHRVYFLGINIGLALLDRLIEGSPDFDPADPHAVALRDEDDALGDEVISTCRTWARRLRRFHPNTVVGPCAVAQVSIASQEESSLVRAQDLAAKFPNYVLAQNCVSTALYALHLIPDAVANAQKTLQRFPHVAEVQAMYYAVAGKEGLYSFLYRGVVRLTFGAVDSDVTTKRVRVVLFLTIIHFVIFFFSFAVNFPYGSVPRISQLDQIANAVVVPTTVLFWAGLALMAYTCVIVVTPRNLVSVLLTDIFVRDTTLNRFLYTSRGLPLINMAHVVMITMYNGNFGLTSLWYTFALYFVLWMLYFPFTSRAFLLRSYDEPRMPVPFWITLILTDIILSPILAVPTVLSVIVEPFMAIAFCAFMPETIADDFVGDVAERLAYNVQHKVDHLAKNRRITSGSEFIHIRFMRFLFKATHSEMETTHLLRSQQDEDDGRVFPLIHLWDDVDHAPLPPPRKRSKTSQELQKLIDKTHANMLAEEKRKQQQQQQDGKAAMLPVTVKSDDDDDDDFRPLGDRTDSFGQQMIAALNFEFDKTSNKSSYHHHQVSGQAPEPTPRAGAGGASHIKRAVIGDTGLFAERRGTEAGGMFAMGGMMRRAQSMRKKSHVFAVGHHNDGKNADAPLGGVDPPAAQFMAERRRSSTRKISFDKLGHFAIDDDDEEVISSLAGTLTGADKDKINLGLVKKLSDNKMKMGVPRVKEEVPVDVFESESSSSASDAEKHDDTDDTSKKKAAAPPAGKKSSANVQRKTTEAHFANKAKSHGGESGGGGGGGGTPPVSSGATVVDFSAFSAFDSQHFEPEDNHDDNIRTPLVKSNAPPPPTRNPLVAPQAPAQPPPPPKPVPIVLEPAAERVKKVITSPPPTYDLIAPEINDDLFQLDVAKKTTTSSSEEKKGTTVSPPRQPPAAPPAAVARRKSPPLAQQQPTAPPPAQPQPPKIPHTNSVSPRRQSETRPMTLRSTITMDSPPKSATGGASGVVAPRSPPLVSPSMLTLAAAQPSSNSEKQVKTQRDFFDTDDDEDDAAQAGSPSKQQQPIPPSNPPPPSQTRSFVKPASFRRSPTTMTAGSGKKEQPALNPKKKSLTYESLNLVESDGDDDEGATPRMANNPPPLPGGKNASTFASFHLPRFIPPDDDKPVINGNTKMRKLIDEFRQLRTTTNQHLRECDDEDTMAFLRRSLASAKAKFVQDTARIANGANVQVDIFELKKQLLDIFSETYKEGDAREGNPELMACLFHTLHLADMTSMLMSKKWLQDCIAQDMPFYFGVFMSHQSVYDSISLDQVKTFLSTGSKSKLYRVDFTLFMFAMARKSRLCYDNFTPLQPHWQSAFESVISIAQIKEGESRQNRADLVENALTHPYINIDVNLENPGDKQTIFSRACREGDIALVKYLLQNDLVADINAVQSDGTNALQQATARNMPNVVLYLCQEHAKQIAKSCTHQLKGRGTALDIAIATQADRRIENALRTIDLTHVGGDHLRSSRNLKAEEEEAAKNARAAAAQAANDVPRDATQILRVSIATILPLKQQMKQTELDHREEEAKHIQQMIDTNKYSLAQRLEKQGNVLEVTADDVREQTLAFLDSLVLEGDTKQHNGQLFAVICRTMATSLSLPSQSVRRLWIHRAAELGSLNFIRSMLTMRGMETYLALPKYDSVISDIIKYVGYCKFARIDVTRELLKYADVLCLDDRLDYLAPFWAKLFLEMIPNYENRKPAEARANRIALVQELVKNPHHVKWDMHAEVSGMEHSVFSKACAEGDAEFVQFCFQAGLVTREQGNRVLSTGITPIAHAIAKKREAVVKVLVQYSPRIIDLSVKSTLGTPVEMAKLSGSAEIVKLLSQPASIGVKK